jgi:hypothetical protein
MDVIIQNFECNNHCYTFTGFNIILSETVFTRKGLGLLLDVKFSFYSLLFTVENFK